MYFMNYIKTGKWVISLFHVESLWGGDGR
jgi:hypothetical protein